MKRGSSHEISGATKYIPKLCFHLNECILWPEIEVSSKKESCALITVCLPSVFLGWNQTLNDKPKMVKNLGLG